MPSMKKVIHSLLISFIVSNMAYAADARLGVATLEELQKREAIKSAQTAQSVPVVTTQTTLGNETVIFQPPEEPSEIEKKVSESLDPVSLEEKIQRQTVQDKLELFGYDIFTRIASNTSTITRAPVPPNYIVGPGDNFTIQAYSAADVQYSLTVTNEGMLLIPEVGAISVDGLPFQKAKDLISSKIENQRIGMKTVVTLTELRSIQIMLVGEVAQPGSYVVSGFSTLTSALVSSGGIKRTGSLRKIQVKRNGQVIAVLDLYKLLLKGDNRSNIHLRQGDLIFVPPIGSTIGIAGETLRPAIYEINDEKTVGEIVALSGGLLPTANKSKAQIERVSDTGLYTLLQADLSQQGSKISLNNGDLIRVLPILDKLDDVVLLTGHVLTPGGYQWTKGMKISDLISSTNILRQGAEFAVALVQRENRTDKRTNIIYFNLGNALANKNSSDNLELHSRDQVIIFDTHSPRANQLSRIVLKLKREATADKPIKAIDFKGALRHPGTYPLQPGTRLLDMIDNAGGLEAGVDLNYTLIARTDLNKDRVYFVKVSLAKALKNKFGDHNPILQPKDKVYLFDKDLSRGDLIKAPIERIKRETQFGQFAPVIQISGAVFHPGTYPLIPGMRAGDLIEAAGGMKEEAFGISASLSRQVMLDNEFNRTDTLSISLKKKDPLLNSLDLILHPKDHLLLRTKPEWIAKPKTVRIEGEVVYPGSYRIDKRESLCSLVQKVGGFTEDAYLFGTVFLRDSVRLKEQKALDRTFDQLKRLLTDTHITQGFNQDQKMPVHEDAEDVYNVLKKMSPEKAVGRMVIDMENAVENCHESADIVLEDGDRIIVPKYQDDVSVIGQVYFPTSHKYRAERAALDYIGLSGGLKELAQHEHAYIVQANGEVMSIRSNASSWGWLNTANNVKVTPGSTIFVPLSVDRINGREYFKEWVDIVYKHIIGAATLTNLITPQ